MNITNQDKLSPMLGKYLKAYEENPSGRLFLPLAEAYRKIGENKKAMEILVKGIKLHPTYHTAYISLANCYFDSKSYELAYSTLRPFVHLHKDNLKVQHLYGDICLKLNFKDEALESYKLLLFLNPKDKEIAKLVSQLEMGASFISEKSTPAQLDNLETPELLQIENTSESTVDDWIRLDIASPEKTNKIEQWQEIKSNFTNDEQINADESVVLSLDSLEDSNVSVPQAVDQGPPFITHTLIDLYEGQGHLDKAIEVLEKIVQIKPDDKKSLDRLVILKSKLNATEDNYVRDEAELGRSKLMALFDEKIGVQKNSKIDPKDVQVNMEKYGERLLIKLAERAREGSKINSDFE